MYCEYLLTFYFIHLAGERERESSKRLVQVYKLIITF